MNTPKSNHPLQGTEGLPWYHGLKIAVYTCISGLYDDLQPVTENENSTIDFIAFHGAIKDHDDTPFQGWKLQPLHPSMPPDLDQVKKSRYHKINPHLVLPEYDLTIWIDGNMLLNGDPLQHLPMILSHPADMALVIHPMRNCVYEEAKVIKKLRKDTNYTRLTSQIQEMKNYAYPARQGLYESGFMIRVNNDRVNPVMNRWWQQVLLYSHRDQLSLPYALWCGDTPNPAIVQMNTADRLVFVQLNKHRLVPKKLTKIHICTPFDHTGVKNLGKAYNDYVSSLPTDSWVLVQDYDIMWLNHNFYQNFQLAIEKHPDAGLFTCYASRSANSLQQLEPVCDGQYGSENDSIRFHKAIADELDTAYEPGTCTDITEQAQEQYISGFAMLFHKSVWSKVGGFREVEGNCLGIDNDFCRRVLEVGKHVYRVDNNYALHYYRLAEGQNFMEHLR